MNGHRPYFKNISELEYPYVDGIIVQRYKDFTLYGNLNMQMMSFYGCPAGCRFCYITFFYENSIYMPPKLIDIAKELICVKGRHKAKQVYFDDDTISINLSNVRGVSLAIINKEVDLHWTCMGDITFREENTRLMAKVNCVGMKFGVELMDLEVPRKMHKGIVSSNKVLAFTSILIKYRISTLVTFSLVHPSDIEDTLRANIEFIKILKRDSILISMATAVPSNEFLDEVRGNGWLTTNARNYFDKNHGASICYSQLSSETINALFKEFRDDWNSTERRLSGCLKLAVKGRYRIAERLFE